MRPPRSRLLLLIPVLVTVAAALQAIALNRASTFLPSSWAWAEDPTASWLLVAATTSLTIGLALAWPKLESAQAQKADRRGLEIQTSFSFQTSMFVHKPPSTRIRWTPVFELTYTGSSTLALLDLVPTAPVRKAEFQARGEKAEVRFVRTKTSQYYRVYSSYGAIVEAQREKDEDDFHRADDWPLLLRPGQRLRIAVEQEYEFQVNGSPLSFASNADALKMLGPYFDLRRDDRGFAPRSTLLPTHVICGDGSWEVDVPYLLMPAGVTLITPSEAETLAMLERDDLV